MSSSPTSSQCSTANETGEAAALQRWLVANARLHRPMDSTGLMAWALAALQALSLKDLNQ